MSAVLVAIATSLPLFIFTMNSEWQELSLAERDQRAAAAVSSFLGLIMMIPQMGALAWLYRAIEQRRKWPRVLLVIGSITTVLAVLGFGRLTTGWSGILTVVAGLLMIAATGLLFTSEASDWFNGYETKSGGVELFRS